MINAGLNLRVSSKFYVLRGSAEQDKLTQWKYEAVLGHYLRGCCGIFCSTGQAGCLPNRPKLKGPAYFDRYSCEPGNTQWNIVHKDHTKTNSSD